MKENLSINNIQKQFVENSEFSESNTNINGILFVVLEINRIKRGDGFFHKSKTLAIFYE